MIIKVVNVFLMYMCLEIESFDFKTLEMEEGGLRLNDVL